MCNLSRELCTRFVRICFGVVMLRILGGLRMFHLPIFLDQSNPVIAFVQYLCRAYLLGSTAPRTMNWTFVEIDLFQILLDNNWKHCYRSNRYYRLKIRNDARIKLSDEFAYQYPTFKAVWLNYLMIGTVFCHNFKIYKRIHRLENSIYHHNYKVIQCEYTPVKR